MEILILNKRIFRENIVFFLGVLFIISSMIIIIVSSYHETVVLRKNIDIDISRGLLNTLSEIIGVRGVVETIEGNMSMRSLCDKTINISVYKDSNLTIIRLDPMTSRDTDITLDTLIEIRPTPNCSINLNIYIRYAEYKYAYLNFLAFILVISGSIMIFRHMLRQTRRVFREE